MKTFIIAFLLAHMLALAGTEDAARGIIGRVVPQHAGEFVVETLPAEDGRDVFEVESKSGKIVLRGNTGVAIASALNHYLKTVAHCHLSWCGDQLNLLAVLPAVPDKIRIVNPHRYRVMFNYCTLSYQKQLAADLADIFTRLPAGTINIGRWQSNEITTAGKELTLDLTKAIKDEGDYEITFTRIKK